MIAGTYTSLKFAATLDGEQSIITPISGFFAIPSDGYLFVTGGNATDTEIWMTWSDWTEDANGGVFAAYSSSTIDLTGVMADFPDGLMRVGNVYDEINLNVGKAYSRIEKMAYTSENLAAVIASGVAYDTDTNYIYAARVSPVAYTISLDGQYTVSDHGMEYFVGTPVALTASSLYGNDLKGKLRRDVLTISQQTLTPAQKEQVKENLGIVAQTHDTNIDGTIRQLYVKAANVGTVNDKETKAVAFATPFPNACVTVICYNGQLAFAARDGISVGNVTKNGFDVYQTNSASAGHNIKYIAFGY